MTSSTHITVLGGGPAGLATAAAACDRGLETVVLEAADRIGGTCRTHSVDGFRFDSGAHRVHDKDPEITNWLSDRLGDRLHEVSAPSRIWDDGRLLGFPISAGELFRHLGFVGSAGAGLDLVLRRLSRNGGPDNFRDYALSAYGLPVASRFLLNYSEKLWGAPCEKLSTEIAGSRLSGLDLRTFISESLGQRNESSRHVEGRFFYPKGGIEAVPETLAEACGPANIRTASPVATIEHDHTRVVGVRVDGGERLPVDQVVSSLPLDTAVSLFEPKAPAATLAAAERLRFRQVVLVALFIDRPSLTDSATIYFPDRRFEFTRLCEPRNRCRTMAPDGRTSVVAEIPCFSPDPVWSVSDEEALAIVREPLVAAGWFADNEVIGGAVRRLHNAYPVLEIGIEDALAEIGMYLGQFENLHLVGRGGTFTYGWIHNMIREGRRAVADITR